jgi:hypothetical protein
MVKQKAKDIRYEKEAKRKLRKNRREVTLE